MSETIPITESDKERFYKKVHNAATRSSTAAWFESPNCKIWPKDRSGGLITPRLNYLQAKAEAVVERFEDLGLPIRILGLKPRAKGSTTFFSAIDYTHMRRKPAHATVIGGQYAQTKEVWEMLGTYQANDHFNWGNAGEINAKEGRWTNGSRLNPETANDRLAGIAGTIQILHATEVARWSRYGVANAAEVLTNILKCVPLLPDTVIILESTAESASGSFYERFIIATDAEDFISGKVKIEPGSYVRLFAAWFQFADSAMRLNSTQKEHVRKTLDAEAEFQGEQELINLYGHKDANGVMHLGETVTEFDIWEQLAWRRYAIREECKRDRIIFDRDYPHSWRDAFVKSGNRRFNSSGLEVMRKRLVDRVPMHGILELAKNGRIAFRQTEEPEAKVTLFEKPLVGRKYIEGVDPMTGITQTAGEDPDFHSAFVLRAGYWDNMGKWVRPGTAARVVACRWDIDVFEEEVWRLARFYGGTIGCKIVIEMNMDRGLTELLKQRGADLYQREIFNRREFKTTTALGYYTNEKTREALIETLAKAVREWDRPGEGIDIFCPRALGQLENFVVKANGRCEADEGAKDDDIFAIALTLHLIEHATTYSPQRMGADLPPDLRNALTPQQSGASPYS